MKLHHIGFATNDLQKYADMFYNLEGSVMIKKGICKKYGAECWFIEGDNFKLELIKPTVKGNHLDKFIQKRGNALHHIAIYGKGKYKGALPNMYVNFLDLKDTEGLLIETVEFRK